MKALLILLLTGIIGLQAGQPPKSRSNSFLDRVKKQHNLQSNPPKTNPNPSRRPLRRCKLPVVRLASDSMPTLASKRSGNN